MQSVHTPVLLHEVVEALAGMKLGARRLEIGERFPNSQLQSPNSTPWYLDGTLGGAGHARAIAEAFHGKVNVIGLDRDPQAINRAGETLKGLAERVVLAVEDFRNLDRVLDREGIRTIDRILLDLGISSDELDNSGRGFTFQKDEPLLMTLGDPDTYQFTAKDIVNTWEEDVIANIIFGYGEDRFARRIARAIVNYRAKKKIETSAELAELVKGAVPAFVRRGSASWRIHPATKTFQALRIAVNDELNALKEGLRKGYERLATGGIMAVISFHSLEDRIVKDFYKTQATIDKKDKKSTARAHILTKKPITPSAQEIAENPRSRSAKLRIIQKV